MILRLVLVWKLEPGPDHLFKVFSYNILLWYCLVEICDDIFYHPWNEYLILKKTTFTLFISRFCHLLSRNKIVKISISFIIFQNKHGVAVYGHIMLKTPVLVWSLKLSNATLSHVSTWMGGRLGIHGAVDIFVCLKLR